jgi:hypothetical protein
VRPVDEGGEALVRAEVRVDGGEVEPPVPVVARATRVDGLLFQDRRDPERGEAEVVDPLEAVGQPLQVAAVEVAGVGRVVAGDVGAAGQPAAVVRRIAVGVPVGHDEVDALGRERARRTRLCQCRSFGRRRRRDGSRISASREEDT